MLEDYLIGLGKLSRGLAVAVWRVRRGILEGLRRLSRMCGNTVFRM